MHIFLMMFLIPFFGISRMKENTPIPPPIRCNLKALLQLPFIPLFLKFGNLQNVNSLLN
jgi:hypothetical protein